MKVLPRKVAIVGSGFVGSSTAFALMMSGLVSEIALIDISLSKAEGEAMDLAHAASFIKPVDIYHGDFSACENASLIIYTAGANQKPGETRIDLVHKNTQVLKDTIPLIVKYAPKSIILMVTNPVDILTYAALKISGFPPERVIGSGTVLDSSRFRHVLSERCSVDPRNVHGYIIGEHGDTELPVWSLANIGGVSIDSYCSLCTIDFTEKAKEDIAGQVKMAGYEIIRRKGATYYAVALTVKRITEAIFRDENSILTVSGLINKAYGLDDVCLSVPSLVNENGRAKYFAFPIADSELKALHKSAAALQQIQAQLKI
ncbi:MAG: L-lactate dehydrogenase [Peptococcaceae bacterium]